MRNLKNHPLLKLFNSYLIDSPEPSNISYLWNFGSLLGVCLVVQIITGVTLAMHYNPNILEAFNSIEHIMRDVNNGWLIRYLHSNTASVFFFLVYLHIGRGIYYGSYKFPRTLVWFIGTIIFIIMVATGFLGYVLPYGQMSLWGATVITNLISAIPWIGHDIVEFIWGGFSVNNATLNRFFSLHYLLPFILAALVLMHLIALHDTAGSTNPLGISGNFDRIPFAPYFLFKDLVTIFIFMFVLGLFVFFLPNILGDSENYIMANPMQTPPAIVPEWYLLPFYAILRSIPSKLLGVITMFGAILIILILPIVDLSKLKGIQFKPLVRIAFWIFVANFLILLQLGARHVESPYIELGQISTILYFSQFLIIIPFICLLQNSFTKIYLFKNNLINFLNTKVYFTNKKFVKQNRSFSSTQSLRIDPSIDPTLIYATAPVMSTVAVGLFAEITIIVGLSVVLLVLTAGLSTELADPVMSRTTEEFVPLLDLINAYHERTWAILENYDTTTSNLSVIELQHSLSYFEDMIAMHEEVFDNLANAVNNCEEDHAEFNEFNHLYVEHRNLGNAILERYREIENELQSRGLIFERLPQFWFEDSSSEGGSDSSSGGGSDSSSEGGSGS